MSKPNFNDKTMPNPTQSSVGSEDSGITVAAQSLTENAITKAKTGTEENETENAIVTAEETVVEVVIPPVENATENAIATTEDIIPPVESVVENALVTAESTLADNPREDLAIAMESAFVNLQKTESRTVLSNTGVADPKSTVMSNTGVANPKSAVLSNTGVADPKSTVLSNTGVANPNSTVLSNTGVANPNSTVLSNTGIANPNSTVLSNTGVANPNSTVLSYTGVGNPTPTVLIDMAGNVSFEEGGGVEPRISSQNNTDIKEKKSAPIVKIISSRNLPDEKTSTLNTMLEIQQFPSDSQTALNVQAPSSFARKITIPIESEPGVGTVQRQGGVSNITSKDVIISIQNVTSNKEGGKPSTPLVVERSIMSIHLSRQEIGLDDNDVKAVRSTPFPAVIVGEEPVTTIPLRRSKSQPHRRKRSILEKLPEDIKNTVRLQLQEISAQLKSVVQELVLAADKIELSTPQIGPPNNTKK